MNKLIRLLALIMVITTIFAVSYYITFHQLNKDDGVEVEHEESMSYEDEPVFDNIGNESMLQSYTESKARITPSTKMIFQYYYSKDDELITDESEPTYYILNMGRQELELYYPEWEILSFSSQEVLLRKTINDNFFNGYYIVREYNGNIAVFYDYLSDFEVAFDEMKALGEYTDDQRLVFLNQFLHLNESRYLKELYDIPVTIVSQEEQDKLVEGIKVFGDENLIRLLENYTS